MRLFTGISIAPHVREKLEAALVTLRPTARLNWSPPENLHITTKFIGEWPENGLTELGRALKTVTLDSTIAISIAQFGFFPNPRRPRVLYSGVFAGPALAELAGKIDDALEPLGCAREQREYTPHLTLARIGTQDTGGLNKAINAMNDTAFGNFEASEFHLYLSNRVGNGKTVYTKLSTYPFMKEIASRV